VSQTLCYEWKTTKGHEIFAFVSSLETSPGILYLFPRDNDFKPMLSRTTESLFQLVIRNAYLPFCRAPSSSRSVLLHFFCSVRVGLCRCGVYVGC
jgi:hypothetical protein